MDVFKHGFLVSPTDRRWDATVTVAVATPTQWSHSSVATDPRWFVWRSVGLVIAVQLDVAPGALRPGLTPRPVRVAVLPGSDRYQVEARCSYAIGGDLGEVTFVFTTPERWELDPRSAHFGWAVLRDVEFLSAARLILPPEAKMPKSTVR